MKTWALQDAKARLSEVVRAAKKKPQRITQRGEEAAVVISPEEYRSLQKKSGKGKEKTFYEIWSSAPKVPEFEPMPRTSEPMRKVDFD